MTSEPDGGWDVLLDVARTLGATEASYDIEVTVARLRERRFHVALVGQFKRGKSMLMNALLGESLMPVGVTPVTSAIVVVRHGMERRAHVELAGGERREVSLSELSRYVTEEENPGNRLGVRQVEALLPNQLLSTGLSLVDTPGIGSVFAANTAETRAFVPHIDVAVVVLGADPPISGDELQLLEDVAARIDDVLLVLNKADRLASDEVDQAASFTQRVVAQRVGRALGPLLLVSAKEVLETGAPTRDWSSFRARLEELAARSGTEIVRGAGRRAAERIGHRLLAEVEERRAALGRTEEESLRRIDALRSCASDAENSLADLAHLLQAEQERFDLRLEKERARFMETELGPAQARLAAAVSVTTMSASALRRTVAQAAREIARPAVLDWNDRTLPLAQALHAVLARRFIKHVQNFMLALAATSPEFARSGVDVEHDLDPRRSFRFTELLTGASPWLLERLGDRLLPRRLAIRRVQRFAVSYLDDLLVTNSSRAANDYKERSLESRRRLESQLRTRLREVVTRAERARDQATAVRAEGEAATGRRREEYAALEVRVMDAVSRITHD